MVEVAEDNLFGIFPSLLRVMKNDMNFTGRK